MDSDESRLANEDVDEAYDAWRDRCVEIFEDELRMLVERTVKGKGYLARHGALGVWRHALVEVIGELRDGAASSEPLVPVTFEGRLRAAEWLRDALDGERARVVRKLCEFPVPHPVVCGECGAVGKVVRDVESGSLVCSCGSYKVLLRSDGE